MLKSLPRSLVALKMMDPPDETVTFAQVPQPAPLAVPPDSTVSAET